MATKKPVPKKAPVTPAAKPKAKPPTLTADIAAEVPDVIDEFDDDAPIPVATTAKPKPAIATDDDAVIDPFEDDIATPPPPPPPSRKARIDPTVAAGPKQTGNASASPGRPVITTVTMDDRKLTKKQVGQLESWRGKNQGKMVDAYFSGQLQAARQKFGHRSVMVGRPDENLIVCLPTPGALAFEYVIGQAGFPLGLIIQMVGKAGSLKSAMLFEFFRWFIMAGGGGHLEEAESKWSPPLLRGVTRQRPDQNRVLVDRCNSVEEWQQRLMHNLEDNKKKLVGTKEEPGPGRTVPILYGVDSIMGKPSINTQEKVNDQGHGSKMFPEEALIITQWMKTVPHLLDNWPFAIVLNNHLKIGQDKDGNEQRRTGGGVGVNFQESWELETSVRKSKLTCADWEGVQISLRCAKNSFGPTGRQADIRMLWWDEADPESETGYTTKFHWDWDWATVKLLTSEYLPANYKAKLKEQGVHVKAEKASDVENTAWSSTLGMKAKDAIPWDELGRRLVANVDVLRRIRLALGIRERPFLAGNYLQQLETLREGLT